MIPIKFRDLPNTQSPQTYIESIFSKADELFSKNKEKIGEFAIATLPISFIAWPLALAWFFCKAKYEVDETLAWHRLDFTKQLSEELSNPKNKTPEEVFDQFIETKSPDLAKIFSKDAEKSVLIRFAQVFANTKKIDKDSISQWENIIKTENKIRKCINKRNHFLKLSGTTNQTIPTSYQKAKEECKNAKEQLQCWRKYPISQKQSISNTEVLRRITKDHGLPLKILNDITSFLTKSSTKKGNERIAECAEWRLKILGILESFKEPKKLLERVDHLGQVAALIDMKLTLEAELFYMVLYAKLMLSVNTEKSISDIKKVVTEKINEELNNAPKPRETWKTSSGADLHLTQDMLRDLPRSPYPIIVGSDSKNCDIEEKNRLANTAKTMLDSWQKQKDKKLTQEEVADSIFAHFNPLFGLIDSIAETENFAETKKDLLLDRCLSCLTQEFPNFANTPYDLAWQTHPANKLAPGLNYYHKGNANRQALFKNNMTQQEQLLPVTFSFDKSKKEVRFEFQLPTEVAEAQFFQTLPVTVGQRIQIVIDVTDDNLKPRCEALQYDFIPQRLEDPHERWRREMKAQQEQENFAQELVSD